MICTTCGAENDTGKKFCGRCGAKLVQICPRCAAECPARDSFCGECGFSLKPPSAPAPKELPAREKVEILRRSIPKNLMEKVLAQKDKMEGERKQVTVMFCDMVGFTSLSERLGPEEAYSFMDRIYELLIHKVYEYEGTVNEMTGDGIMALFGAPIALEDASQRAIRSALAIHKDIAQFNDIANKEINAELSIKMRIGIHTGPVVVGSLGNDLHVEFKAVGDTVNLASRLEAMAEPGTIFVTQEIFRQTEGIFRFESIGEVAVKGIGKPVKIYRVIAPSTRRTRFDVSAERGLAPFVGRDRELELLVDGYERVKGGRGQAFSVTSDAGVGKSRLLYEFRKVISNEDVNFLEGKCLSYGRGTAYHPVIDILESYFDIWEGDKDAEISEKVKKGLIALDADEASTLPYLLELLSVKDGGIDTIPYNPEVTKANILDALKRIVLKSSETKPLILAIEDLHWVDKSSEEALRVLLDSISGSRVLLLFTYRPDFVHTWGGRSYHSQVNLNRLSNRESIIMMSNLLGTKDIGGELEDFILGITEGVPFFIEEFVKSLKDLKVIEKKDKTYVITQDLEKVTVPSTIQDVIMARVDSLPEPTRNVLQIGSVIGREFDFGLMLKITEIPEPELLSYLSILKNSELLFERGIYPQTTFIFKHALTQEAAYHSLLKSTRQKYHDRVARVLEEHFPDTLKTQPELLGHHFTEASLPDRAVPCWQRAGEIAIRRSLHMAAVDHFSKALGLLKTLPETPERKRQELRLQIALYAPLSAVKGYSAPEVGKAYDRARELCEQIGEPAQLFLVLYGLWGHNLIRSNLKTTPMLAEQCLVLAQSSNEQALLMEAHRMCGETALYRGELALAQEHLEQSSDMK